MMLFEVKLNLQQPLERNKEFSFSSASQPLCLLADMFTALSESMHNVSRTYAGTFAIWKIGESNSVWTNPTRTTITINLFCYDDDYIC